MLPSHQPPLHAWIHTGQSFGSIQPQSPLAPESQRLRQPPHCRTPFLLPSIHTGHCIMPMGLIPHRSVLSRPSNCLSQKYTSLLFHLEYKPFGNRHTSPQRLSTLQNKFHLPSWLYRFLSMPSKKRMVLIWYKSQ